jgi:hypothetical protein
MMLMRLEKDVAITLHGTNLISLFFFSFLSFSQDENAVNVMIVKLSI